LFFLSQVIVVSWVYGFDKAFDNIHEMGMKFNKILRNYWWLTWVVLTPIFSLVRKYKIEILKICLTYQLVSFMRKHILETAKSVSTHNNWITTTQFFKIMTNNFGTKLFTQFKENFKQTILRLQKELSQYEKYYGNFHIC
jgi:hypothetical protein